jgi:ferredoxin
VDCGICVPECPANAIFADVDLPEDQQHFLQLNAELSRDPGWPVITTTKPPPEDHAEWLVIKDKLAQLSHTSS